MKQLAMTPELSAMIKKAVGDDVETENLAVFETIALNNKPLPGKGGSIFDSAVISPTTLSEMAESINSPNGHLPLMQDHNMEGSPKGRIFHAGVDYVGDNVFELRQLFFVDPGETDSISKLNNGSLDEVSVSFMSKAFNCSACGFDYFGPEAEPTNLWDKTCPSGHTIGKDGVHANMEGLAHFRETSLVARGAADTPKIVGKSQSKLTPTNDNEYRLVAKGFELNELVLQASIGKEEHMSDKLIADLVASNRENATLTSEVASLKADRDAKGTALTAAEARVVELTAEVETLKNTKPADYESSKAGHEAALSFLHEQLDHLMVAKGEPKLEGDARLKEVDAIKAKITELTGNLTSILPVGGVADNGKNKDEDGKPQASFNADAFRVR